MKTIIGAFALILAAPAAAQTAPAADPHAGHGQHQPMDHGKHGQDGHGEHKMDCCKDGKHKECCEKMKQQGHKMECCEGKDGAKPAVQSGNANH